MAADPIGDEDVARFARAVEQLDDVLTRTSGNSGNQSTITLNAGGIGVWIATTACVAMLFVNLMLLAVIISHERKIDDLGDYIHAIYMVAPSLKPEK
jgi:hypothetical protein